MADEPPKKLRRVTVRQHKIAKAMVMYPHESQRAIGARIGVRQKDVAVEIAKPHVKADMAKMMDRALDRAGATIDRSAKVIAEAHDAFKGSSTNDPAAVPIPDHKTRLRAAELNGKFRGLLKSNEDMGGQVMGIGFFILKGLKERGL